MVIFHSYVSLPEGTWCNDATWYCTHRTTIWLVVSPAGCFVHEVGANLWLCTKTWENQAKIPGGRSTRWRTLRFPTVPHLFPISIGQLLAKPAWFLNIRHIMTPPLHLWQHDSSSSASKPRVSWWFLDFVIFLVSKPSFLEVSWNGIPSLSSISNDGMFPFTKTQLLGDPHGHGTPPGSIHAMTPMIVPCSNRSSPTDGRVVMWFFGGWDWSQLCPDILSFISRYNPIIIPLFGGWCPT